MHFCSCTKVFTKLRDESSDKDTKPVVDEKLLPPTCRSRFQSNDAFTDADLHGDKNVHLDND